MKRSIFLCLFSLAFLAGLWPAEPPMWIGLLGSLRIENQRIANCLNSVAEELQAIEKAYAELEKQHATMQLELNDSREALQEREKQLELEQKRLLADKAHLAKRAQELHVSESSLTDLKTTCTKTLQDAEAAIDARDVWIGVALIGIPVAVVVGLVVGLIIK